MNESAAEPRTYLVGLPVAVTVFDDGTVTYEVDTAEAAVAITECEMEPQPPQEVVDRDAERIEFDHYRRNPHRFMGGDGTIQYADVCVRCLRHRSEHPDALQYPKP